MISNSFFKKKIIKIKKIFPNISKDFIINDIKPLQVAKKNDLTFLDSIKYKSNAKLTKASACITTKSLKNFLPNNIQKIIVKNVLLELASVLNKIYSY